MALKFLGRDVAQLCIDEASDIYQDALDVRTMEVAVMQQAIVRAFGEDS